MSTNHKSVFLTLIKAALCSLAYVVGTVLSGMLISALHLAMPNFLPPNANPMTQFAYFACASLLIGFGLLPLAAPLGGSRTVRWLALALLIFVCLGVNTTIEIRIFSTFLAHGGALVLTANVILPALLCGWGLSTLGTSPAEEPPLLERVRSFFSARSVAGWSWRLLLAILAFPFAYFLFGSMVGPYVVEAYRGGIAGLTLPPVAVILKTQLVRSTIFFIASLPFLVLWRKSRLSLFVALGLAHWVLVGLFGLSQAVTFPRLLRILHSIEIGADSFAYAAALVFLLLPRRSENPLPTQAHAAPVFPS